jgi:hypothetical protein
MSLPKLNVPTFELKLPSTGETIKYRPFLVKEHKILLTMSEADDSEVARIVSELIDVCTFNKLNVSKLPHFDIEYIFLMLRAKSIGEAVDVIVNCDCGEKIETSFNIDDIKVERKDGHSSKIMLTSDLGVEMNYPKFSDVIEVYASDDTEKIIEVVVKNIKGIFNSENYWDAKEQTVDEIKEFVYTLTKNQFTLIENFFVTAPKVVQEIECKCPKCGTLNKNRLEGLQNFFV